MMTAKDKHGREFRAGDLVDFNGSVVRLKTTFSVDCDGDFTAELGDPWNGERWMWGITGRHKWEILSRGKPKDPVPEHFEPVRDEKGRPVLEEVRDTRPCPAPEIESNICDGCGRGAPPGTLVHGLVRGKAGAVCKGCASRAIYPVTAKTYAEVVHAKRDGKIACGATDYLSTLSTVDDDVTCLKCRAVIPAKSRPAEQPDFHTRYLAFDKRVREVVAEEAPRATVVTDVGRVRNIMDRAFVAWVDILDKPFTVDVNMTDDESQYAYGFLRREIRDALTKIGARELGKR